MLDRTKITDDLLFGAAAIAKELQDLGIIEEGDESAESSPCGVPHQAAERGSRSRSLTKPTHHGPRPARARTEKVCVAPTRA